MTGLRDFPDSGYAAGEQESPGTRPVSRSIHAARRSYHPEARAPSPLMTTLDVERMLCGLCELLELPLPAGDATAVPRPVDEDAGPGGGAEGNLAEGVLAPADRVREFVAIGGSATAPGATGDAATEDLVNMLIMGGIASLARAWLIDRTVAGSAPGVPARGPRDACGPGSWWHPATGPTERTEPA